MHTTYNSRFHRLGTLVGLSLSLAASACGGGSSDSDTSGTDTGTATGTSTGTGGVTTGGPGDMGDTSTSSPTTGVTTGDTGATSTTGDTSTTSPDTSSTATGDDSTGVPDTSSSSSSGGEQALLGFFVSSTGSLTGDLGGLAGADQRCQDLAEAVGAGGRTWHAYLSAEKGEDDQPVHARDRIGAGPWYNAAMVLVAADLAELHSKDGDADLFLDENGEKVPGQWEGSPDPNQHDILTGSNKDGTVAPGKTCVDWTSDDAALLAQVGHSDGLGPNMSDAEMYRSWNSVHESGGCNDTAPKGGAGRIYCFAID